MIDAIGQIVLLEVIARQKNEANVLYRLRNEMDTLVAMFSSLNPRFYPAFSNASHSCEITDANHQEYQQKINTLDKLARQVREL